MLVITTPLAPAGLIAIAYLGIIFAKLSQRLNEVTKRGEHYRWFRVANILVALAAASQAIRGVASVAANPYPILLKPWFALVSFHIPLAMGVTLDLVLVWYYWVWAFKEKVE